MFKKRILLIALICTTSSLIFFLFSHTTGIGKGLSWQTIYRFLWTTEYALQDQIITIGETTPIHEDVVFIGIDEASLTIDEAWEDELAASRGLQLMREEFPWSRKVYAIVIEKLINAGARVVCLDLLFEQSRRGDEAFSAVLEKYSDRVVIGANFDASNPHHAFADVLSLPADSVIDWAEFTDPRIGFVNLWPDLDGVIRSTRFRVTPAEAFGRASDGSEDAGLSLVAAAATQAGYGGVVPPDSKPYNFRLAENRPETLQRYSFQSLFIPIIWETTFDNGALFKDKIVFIGPVAERFQDSHRTSIGVMWGPELHVNILHALLGQSFYRTSGVPINILLFVVGTLLALGSVVFMKNPLFSFLLMLGFGLLYLGLQWHLYNNENYLIIGFLPLAAFLIGGLTSLTYDYTLEKLDKLRVRNTLERYVSRNVVSEILDNRDDYLASLGGTRKVVTILFSDVRGFTSMSEKTDASDLVAQLNEYLGEMVDVVFKHNGTVDKFIGDAVMAVWGNVSSRGQDEDARLAVETAIGMREALAKLNTDWRAKGRPEYKVGIGLHFGDVIFGNIGSEQKMEPTVIGDSVNLASRIEGLTKAYQSDILISETVAERLGDEYLLRTAGRVKVVGKTKPIGIFQVVGLSKYFESDLEWLKSYEDAIATYLKADFPEAISSFEECLTSRPDDFLCQHYITLCKSHIAEPPPADWDGTETMKKK